MGTSPRAGKNRLPPSQVTRLADLISYQEGAVVSRTLMKQPSGNITAFAFDAGQGLTEHTVKFAALVQILEGKAEITISNQPFELKRATRSSCPQTSLMH
jgi:quercetin dioxygenase-like cupin family protein